MTNEQAFELIEKYAYLLGEHAADFVEDLVRAQGFRGIGEFVKCFTSSTDPKLTFFYSFGQLVEKGKELYATGNVIGFIKWIRTEGVTTKQGDERLGLRASKELAEIIGSYIGQRCSYLGYNVCITQNTLEKEVRAYVQKVLTEQEIPTGFIFEVID